MSGGSARPTLAGQGAGSGGPCRSAASWRSGRAILAGQRGQAALEILGVLPAVLALGLVVFQLLAVGYAAVTAGAAAEAGALALVGGADPERGVRDSLPGWSRSRAHVTVAGGTVRVRLRPPSLLSSVSRRLEVTGRASVGGR